QLPRCCASGAVMGRYPRSHSFAGDRGIGNCCQAFPRHVIHDVENAETAALGELVMDEIELPTCIALCLDKDPRACADGPAPGLALADCQPFFAVEPINAVDA